jgi:gliding motility-associated lipoprotein GldD
MNHTDITWMMATGIALLLMSCGEEAGFTPKPRGYPRVVYPEKAYQQFEKDYCPFTFSYPVYAQIQRDTAFFESRSANDCWFDIFTPQFDSRVHCSYYPIGASKSLERLKEDAFEMADWHNKRANYIDEIPIEMPEKKVYGIAFEIEGPAASSYQFYLTDSTDHFIRGALYFNTEARPDSLAPVISFVREDVKRLISSFEWRE